MYGKELILDLHDCMCGRLTREHLTIFFNSLCELIDMEQEDLHFWDYDGDPDGYDKAPAHLKGISAVQFIKTSNITIHTLDELGSVYLNIFSCKSFDRKIVERYAEEFFEGNIKRSTFLERG